MNTDIKCFIEFNAGLGAADLVLKVNDVPVIVECKVGKTAEDAIQQIKDRGYYHVSILGEFESAFLVGVNFNQKKGEDLMVEEHEVLKPEGLINVLMKKNTVKEEWEKEIIEELKLLCYTKNIGICNPENPSNHNEADPKNKYVGSFTTLILGQILQYFSQNKQFKLERIHIEKSETNKVQHAEFTIAGELQLNITEFTDKGGNFASPLHSDSDSSVASPDSDTSGKYNIEIEVIKGNSSKFVYRIEFSDKGCDVYLHNHTCISPQSNNQPTVNLPSSQESSESICEDVDVEEVGNIDPIEDIKNGETGSLRRTLEIFKGFIHSEANLQLLLKGLFMNTKIGGKQVIAETEVGTGQVGKIDLLVKFPNGEGMIFECKFCEKEGEIEEKRQDARSQLKGYTDKGNLRYILDQEPYKVAIVFCKKSKEACVVDVEMINFTQAKNIFQESYDSGIGSSTSTTPNTSMSSLSSISLSPGDQEKATSPEEHSQLLFKRLLQPKLFRQK